MNHADISGEQLSRRGRPDAQHLSAVLLRLHDAAYCGDVSAFQDYAISILHEVVSFHGSWWGSGVGSASGHYVHGSHLRNLPVDLPQMLNAISPDNAMARVSAQNPDKACLFRADTLYSNPAVTALSEYMGVQESLCITQTDRVPWGSLRFLVITRGPDDPPFADMDKLWLELLNPHLNASLDLCCSVEVARWHRLHDEGILLAISDAKGFLYLSEPGLLELLLEEWPDWQGHALPDNLVRLLADGAVGYNGRSIIIEFRRLGERIMLSLRRRHAFDALSPQERAISIAFASGQSYKLVARNVGIAPATVRHHLRSAYSKLGVSDKAALAQLAATWL